MRLAKSTLVTAAVTGTVWALAAAGTASATTVWPNFPNEVPAAHTNTTPGLAAFYQNLKAGTFVVWKGQRDNNVHYKFKVNGKWSASQIIPGAHTDASPAAAFYTDARSKGAELVAWKALRSHTIYYATGEIGAKQLWWTRPHSIAVKGDSLAFSDTGPSLLFPLNSPNGRVIIAWRGPRHHVRYQLGTPGTGKQARLFNFDKSSWISPNTLLSKTTTSGTPALAEAVDPSTHDGTVYVFWKADGRHEAISYASTPDVNKTGLTGNATIPWTLLAGVPGAASTSNPAASDLSPFGTSALMLAYKGPSGDAIRYQLLSAGAWSAPAFVTGHDNKTAVGPALNGRLLANDSLTTSGVIFLRHYSG